MQIFFQGPIRALGLQKVASYFAIGCYWVISLPLAYFLGIHKEYGVIGLIGGFSIAVTIQCFIYLIIVMTRDWQKIADEAAERIKEEDATT